MSRPRHHWNWDFVTRLRAAVAAFPLSFTLLLTLSASQPAHAQNFKVIHYFSGGEDGAFPESGLTMDSAGNLYGTTSAGYGDCGTFGCGTVFELKHTESGWVFNTIYTFRGGSDGAQPTSRVKIGPDGSLYDTTYYGGGECIWYYGGSGGCGTVYKLTPSDNGWTETVLYSFGTDRLTDGANPYSPVTLDQHGDLYGTTHYGSQIAYQLSQTESGWGEAVIARLAGYPLAGMTFDKAGNLYGVSPELFQLQPTSSGWQYHRLAGFWGDALGAPILDGDGNVYFATDGCGPYQICGGMIFRATPMSNGQWTLSELYTFPAQGYGPSDSLVMDSAGNLYGTTWNAGAYGHGSVFKLAPPYGAGATYTSLHDFTGQADGGFLYGNVIFGPDGNLYGTTFSDSAENSCACGLVFEITP